MNRIINNDWWNILKPQFESDNYQQLRKFLVSEYKSGSVNPSPYWIYNAFKLTPFNKVKVVILGQDPYPSPNTAMGLSFSVMPGHVLPRSLQNIYTEMHNDIGTKIVNNGCLVPWTKQGVLLLNSVLTCRTGQSGSHSGHGWEQLTNYAIQALSNRKQPVIFVLWGRKAQEKLDFINTNRNIIITSSHPSPFSAHKGFFGSHPFSKINYALKTLKETPINWQLPATYTMNDLKEDLNNN